MLNKISQIKISVSQCKVSHWQAKANIGVYLHAKSRCWPASEPHENFGQVSMPKKMLKPPGKNMLGNRCPHTVSKLSPHRSLINDKGTRWPELTSLRMGHTDIKCLQRDVPCYSGQRCVVWIWSWGSVSQPQSRDILHNTWLYNPSKGSKLEKTKKDRRTVLH